MIWPFKRRRKPEEVLISALDAIAFIALHAQEEADLRFALHCYRSAQREAKAGRLEQIELRLKMVAASIGKEIEEELTRKRGRASGE